jgi:hypothetical protein
MLYGQAKKFPGPALTTTGITGKTNADNHSGSGGIMTIEERKMSRPDSRWKAELRNLYRSAESNRSEATDENERHYQTGVMTACCSIWHRVTGEQLV